MKKGFILSIIFFSHLLIKAQDIDFSQYNLSKINTNPAFTGSDSTFVFSNAYLINLHQAYCFSIDNYFHQIRGGFGINYYCENMPVAESKTSIISFNYAPHIELFNHKLVIQPGIQVAHYKRTSVWGSYVIASNNQVVSVGSVEHNFLYWNYAAGLLLYGKKLYGGIAFYNLVTSKDSDKGAIYEQRGLDITYHAGGNFQFGNFIVSPNLLYRNSGDYIAYQIGINSKYKWCVIGAAIDGLNDFILNGGLQNAFFQLSYSYKRRFQTKDYAIDTHELHLNLFIQHRKPSTINSLRLI